MFKKYMLMLSPSLKKMVRDKLYEMALDEFQMGIVKKRGMGKSPITI
jgi:hypothetical protein